MVLKVLFTFLKFLGQTTKVLLKDHNVGDKVEAQVLEVDVENKRISLGVKQLQDNPWDAIEAKYPIGKTVEGTVKAIVDFGIFVDLGETVDALIHVSVTFLGLRKILILMKNSKFGSTVKAAVVLTVDKDNAKFCLGIKQLEEDPWKKIDQRMPVGSVVEGEVVRVTDFGAFVELETGIEGLIHISELSEERVEKAEDVVKVGDKVKALVISIDKADKKIALSKKNADNADLSQFTQAETKTSALAEKLKGFSVKE
jgi:small subunit ribosomal protein S1